MKFAKRGDRQLKQQFFDEKKISFTKAGTTYNNQKFITAANVDTDINVVLKKYGCTVDEATELMKARGGMKAIYADFAELQARAQSIPDIINLKNKADEEFAKLPAEIREKYGNNLENFFTELQSKATELINKKTETKTEDKKEETK